jgi:hypothetical protein
MRERRAIGQNACNVYLRKLRRDAVTASRAAAV